MTVGQVNFILGGTKSQVPTHEDSWEHHQLLCNGCMASITPTGLLMEGQASITHVLCKLYALIMITAMTNASLMINAIVIWKLGQAAE